MKQCTHCKKFKPKQKFNNRRKRKASWCKHCLRENQKNYRRTPEGKIWLQQRHRQEAYGLDPMTYQLLCLSQNNLCLVCKKQKSLTVDHCHKTGKIRGLLCCLCNSGIGHLQDSPSLLKQAIQYLQTQ
jgi:hypothetical protein